MSGEQPEPRQQPEQANDGMPATDAPSTPSAGLPTPAAPPARLPPPAAPSAPLPPPAAAPAPDGWAAPSSRLDPAPWAAPSSTGYSQAAPARSTKTLFIVIGVVAVLMLGSLAAIAGVIALRLRNEGPSAGASTSASSVPPMSGQPDLSLEAIGERYSALGTNLLDDARSCEQVYIDSGQSEHLRCTVSIGDLHLMTYTDATAAAAARTQAIVDAGVVRLTATNEAAGYVQSTKGSTTTVYWDVVGPPAMSATFTTQHPKADAASWWDGRAMTAIARPIEPGSDIVNPVLKANSLHHYTALGASCHTQPPGEGDTESYYCSLSEGYSVSVSLASSADALGATRARFRDIAEGRGTWSLGGAEQGRMYDVTLDGRACRYYDSNQTYIWHVMCAEAGQDRDTLTTFWKDGA